MLIQGLPAFVVMTSSSVHFVSTQLPLTYSIAGVGGGKIPLNGCASISLPSGTYNVAVGHRGVETVHTTGPKWVQATVPGPNVIVTYGIIYPRRQPPGQPALNGPFLVVRLLPGSNSEA